MESNEAVRVGIRIRPLNEKEITAGQEKIYVCNGSDNSVALQKDGHVHETFYYDKVFDDSSKTTDVYSSLCKDIVKNVMNGINGTIFAYGQTSSGKTHTMLGGGDQGGVLELATEEIFSHIMQNDDRYYLLRASFVEIYNETIHDLLTDSNDRDSKELKIREDPERGVYCDAVELVITDYDSIVRALKKGISRRVVEATAMNDTSSRSHTIFKLSVESKPCQPVNGENAVLVSSLNLVDLAGSESVRLTGAVGQRAKEGGKINQSLLSLSRVIHALSQPGSFVSYRDSKLTRLLQNSLSGNARMAIICCVTPAERYVEETKSTLQFASRAKLVKTHAKVNEVVDDSVKISRLKKEIEELNSIIKRMASSAGSNGLEVTLEEYAGTISQQAAALDEAVNQVRLLVEKNEQLEHEKRAMISELDTLREELSGMVAKASEFEAQLRMLSSESAAREEEKQSMMAVVDNLRVEQQASAEEKAQLLARIAELETQAQTATESMMAKIEELSSRLSASESQASNSMETSSRMLELEEALTILNAEKEELMLATTSELEKLQSAAEAEKGEMASKCAELAISNEQLTIAIRELQEALTILNAEKEELMTAAQENAAPEASVPAVDMNGLNEFFGTAEVSDMLDRARQMMERIAALEQELNAQKESFAAALKAAQDDKMALEGRMEALVTDRDQQSSSVMELQEALTIVNAEKEELMNSLQEASASSDLSRKAQELQAFFGVESLEMVVERFQQIQNERDAAVTEKEAFQEEMKTQTAALNAELEVSLAKITEVEAAFSAAETEKTGLLTELAAANERFQGSEANSRSLEEQLAASQVTQEQLSGKIIELESALVAAEDAKNVTETAGNAALSMRIAELEESLALLNAEKEELMASALNAMSMEESMLQIQAALGVQAVDEVVARIREILDVNSNFQQAAEAAEIKFSRMTAQFEQEKSALLSNEERLARDNESYVAKIQELELAVQQTVATSHATNSALESASSRMEELQAGLSSLQAQQSELTAVQGDADSMRSYFSELKALFSNGDNFESPANVVTEVRQVLEKQAQLESTCSSMAAEIESTRDIVSAKQTDIDVVSSTVEVLSDQLAQRDLDLEAMNARVAELEEMMQLSASENEIQVDEASQVSAARSIEKNALLVKIAVLTQEKEQAHTKIVNLEQQLEVAVAPVVSSESDSVLKEVCAVLELDTPEQVVSSVQLLKTANVELQQETGIEYQAVVAQREADISSLSTKIADLEGSLQLAEEEKALSAAELEEIATAREVENVTHQAKVAAMEQKVTELEETISKMVEERAAMPEESPGNEILDELRAFVGAETDEDVLPRVQQFVQAAQELSSKHEAAMAEKEVALESMRAEFEAEKVALTSSIESMREANAQLNVEYDQVAAKLAETEGELQASEETKEMFALKIAELEAAQQTGDLESQLQLAAEKNERLTAELSEVVAARDADKFALDEALMELQALQQDSSSKIGELEEALAAVTAEKEQIAQDLCSRAASGDMSQLQSLLSLEDGDDVVSQVQQLLDDNAAMGSELETLRQSMEESEAEKQTLISSVESLRSQLHQQESEFETLSFKVAEMQEQADDDKKAAADAVSRAEAAEEEKSALESKFEDMKAAVTKKFEAGKEQIANAFAEIDSLTATNETLEAEAVELKKVIAEQKTIIAELNIQLGSQSASEERVESLAAENKELTNTVRSAKSQIKHLEETIATLNEQIEVKDKRIARLDAAKMTTDQMEKIKQIKDERKKFHDDNKILKKQLLDLKTVYEDLKANSTSKNGPSQDYIISDYKCQVAELNKQLSQAQNLSAKIKDKLVECSKQLEEYEKERVAVVAALQQFGIDTTGMLPSENSTLSEEASSYMQADISEGVMALGKKLSAAQDHGRKANVKEWEEKVAHANAQYEDMKAQKLALEKKIDATKASLKSGKDEVGQLTAQIEVLQAEIVTLKAQVTKANDKVAVDHEGSHSKIAMLEDENLELLMENRELRLENARYKMAVPGVPVEIPVAAPSQPAKPVEEAAPTPSRAVSKTEAQSVGSKRAFGTDISNITTNKAPLSVGKKLDFVEESDPSAASAQPTKKRIRNKISTASSVAGQVGEQPGECNQS